MNYRTKILLTISCVAVAAGCSSGEPATSTGSSSSAASANAPAAVDPAETIKGYFEAAGNLDFDAMEANAAPGSPAALYAKSRRIIDVDGTTATSVQTTATEAVLDWGNDSQYTFNDFQFDDTGKLVTWTTSPGGPLAPRIQEFNKTVRVGTTKIQFVGQYVANDGALVLPIRVSNPSSQQVRLAPRNYVNPNGRQLSTDITQGDTTGVMEMAPKARDIGYISTSKGGKPNGRLTVYTYDEDGYTIAEKVISLK